jgi:hypothetical protein
MWNINIKYLKICTVTMLTLPIFLFLVFWLKLYFAVPLAACLLYSFAKYVQNIQAGVFTAPIINFVAVAVIVVAWVAVSGNGGLGYQPTDLYKIVAIQHDLVSQNTPIKYNYQGNEYYLSAYLGFFVTIPLLFGKLVSWQVLQHLQSLYCMVGVMLGILWLSVILKKLSPLLILIFVLVSGFEIFAHIFQFGVGSVGYVFQHFFDVEPFWSTTTDHQMKLFFRSNTHGLFWGPQHIIGCWLAMGLFAYEWLHERNCSGAPYYLLGLFFWSPFVLIGMFPYFVYRVYTEGFGKYFKASNLVLLPVFLVLAWFVSSVPVGSYDKGLIFYKAPRMLFYLDQLKSYVSFYVFEVGIWGLVLYFSLKNKVEAKWLKLLVGVLVLLFIIPFYKLGRWNDFAQWASMPSVFLIWLLLLKSLSVSSSSGRFWLILFVFCSIWDPIYHIGKSLKATNYSLKYTGQPKAKMVNLVAASKIYDWPVEQSVANGNASFFRYMAR